MGEEREGEREKREERREKVVGEVAYQPEAPEGGSMGEEKGLRQRGKEYSTNQKRRENIKGKQRKKRQWWKQYYNVLP